MTKISKNKGIATLPTVMVIGMMALAVVVSITSIALNELFISQGQSQSGTALFYAEAGARDALVRISRSKKYTCDINNLCNTAVNGTDSYFIDFVANGCSNNTNCAEVSVSGNDTAKTITSNGIMKAITRRMEVVVGLDTNGKITSATWTELKD